MKNEELSNHEVERVATQFGFPLSKFPLVKSAIFNHI